VSGVRTGVLVAAAVAGPPLWALVAANQIDSTAALERWAFVAVVCSLAASGLAALVRVYEEQARTRRREQLLAQAGQAVEAGRSTEHPS
jgi:hypothetical protein